jgi:prepilin peptidase CpaA
MDSSGLFLFFFLTIVLLIAAINDIRFRKIPNWLTYPTILIAVAYHTTAKGIDGFYFSVGGMSLGIAVLIVPFLAGGMGAGDTKLMGAVGGLLGPKGVVLAFLFSAILGGIYVLLFLALTKSYKRILRLSPFPLKGDHIASTYTERQTKLCYGGSIALGTFLSITWGWFI